MSENILEIKVLNSSEKLIRFVQTILDLNGIVEFRAVTHFTKPGIIFVEREKRNLIDVREIIFGCKVIYFGQHVTDTYDNIKMVLNMCNQSYQNNVEKQFYSNVLVATEKFRHEISRGYKSAYNIHYDTLVCGPNVYRFYSENLKVELDVFLRGLISEILNGHIKIQEISKNLLDYDSENLNEFTKKYIKMVKILIS